MKPEIATATPSRARKVSTPSELGVARRAREGDRVADVRQPRHVDHEALETETEARVRHGAVAARVAIPLVMRGIQAEFRDARIEDVETLLALRTADDL